MNLLLLLNMIRLQMSEYSDCIKPRIHSLIAAIDKQYAVAQEDANYFWSRLETADYDKTVNEMKRLAKLKIYLKEFIQG